MPQDNRIALRFQLSESTGGSTFAQVIADAIRVNADGDIGYGSSAAWNAVDGLQAFATGSTNDRERAFSRNHTGFGIQVENPNYRTTNNEWQAERAFKLLKSTRTKLERMVEAGYGEPATFGAYVARVAKAQKIEYIAFHSPSGNRWPNGEIFMVQNLADGARHIDNIIAQWRETIVSVATDTAS